MKHQVIIGVALGVAVLGIAWYLKRRAGDVGAAINPLSDQNVFYQGANSTVQALTGKTDVTLGTWIYDFINGDKERQMMNELLSPATLEPRR